MQFRRQHPIGPYIVDFCCVERMLIVELDGGQHEDQRAQDEARTQWLAGRGFRVLRFSDHEALMETEAVLTEIQNHLYTPTPTLPRNLGDYDGLDGWFCLRYFVYMMTLRELMATFPTDEACKQYSLCNRRWPDGKAHCPRCGKTETVYKIALPWKWECSNKECRKGQCLPFFCQSPERSLRTLISDPYLV